MTGKRRRSWAEWRVSSGDRYSWSKFGGRTREVKRKGLVVKIVSLYGLRAEICSSSLSKHYVQRLACRSDGVRYHTKEKRFKVWREADI